MPLYMSPHTVESHCELWSLGDNDWAIYVHRVVYHSDGEAGNKQAMKDWGRELWVMFAPSTKCLHEISLAGYLESQKT